VAVGAAVLETPIRSLRFLGSLNSPIGRRDLGLWCRADVVGRLSTPRAQETHGSIRHAAPVCDVLGSVYATVGPGSRLRVVRASFKAEPAIASDRGAEVLS
jgi:hypothetical protein